VLSHRLCQSATLLLQSAVGSLFQLGYLSPDRVKKREHDASLWCCVPVPNRAKAKGRQNSIYLAQETSDTLRYSSTRCLEILQTLLGDGQLLHLSLCQLPLLHRQSGLLVPQTGLLTIGVKLIGQDLGVGFLQSFPLPVEVGLTMLECGLAGAQDLELTTERDVVQLFPI
jgi:hypothetical protein